MPACFGISIKKYFLGAIFKRPFLRVKTPFIETKKPVTHPKNLSMHPKNHSMDKRKAFSDSNSLH